MYTLIRNHAGEAIFSNTLGAGFDNSRKILTIPEKWGIIRGSYMLEKACGRDSTEGGRTMKHMAQNGFKALTSAWVLALLATVAWSQSITWLGTLPGGSSSEAWGVSADGAVVVGWSYNAAGYNRAFRWTVDGGMQDLGTLGGSSSEAWGVSADGAVVVGWSYNATQYHAFRWTASGGMQDLGSLGGGGSWAYGVSADGSVVVGLAYNAAGYWRAFRWTVDGGMQDLGTLGGGYSQASGVSADGAVVVGWARNAAWYYRAFRWTAPGGMQDLGSLGRDWSVASGVSADGSVVVGAAGNAEGQGRAFRWTASGGMEDLNITYANLLTNGSVLIEARAISPNGRYIVGWGTNAATRRSEAFLLDTGFPPRGDVNRNGCVDDADLLAVLFAFGGQGYRNEDLNWDGIIDDADLLIVLFHFGNGC
jgi:probable HAF family extracellular repeat protein